jgi:hypothetical protein
MGAHLFNFTTHLDKFIGVVDGTGGITDGAMCLGTGSACRFDGALHVAGIIEGIENAENIHAVLGGAEDESFDYIVGEVGILHDVLPAEEHHVRGFRAGFFECIKALKGEFIKETQAGVNGGASPGFEGIETPVIQLFADRKHLLGAHPGRG